MIERAVGCLQKRGNRLTLAAHQIPLKSPRRLHSAFWSHGAGSIDLPSWWLALLQLPPSTKTAEVIQEDSQPRYLDFLYPSQALKFVLEFGNTGPAFFRRRRQATVHHCSRAYTSFTAESLFDISNYASSHEAEAEAIATQPEVGDTSRAKILEMRLDELLRDDAPEADLSGLWQTYLELRSLAVVLKPRQFLRFLRCLARSKSKANRTRSLEALESVPMNERKSIHYSYAISAALNNDNVEAAVRLHSEALANLHVSIGTSSLLSYTVEQQIWQVAIETWQAYWNHKEGHVELPDIWAGVDTIPFPQLWANASSAVDFAAAMTEMGDTGAAAASRGFALQLALRSFAIRNSSDDAVHQSTSVYGLKRYSQFRDPSRRLHSRLLKPGIIEVQHPNIERHQQLFDKATKLQAPTRELFEAAIYQALSFNSRLYTIQALRFYQAFRENEHITPAADFLVALLDQVCEIRSEAGIFLILNDYRYYHGRLTFAVFRRVIPGLAELGNRTAVEDLLDEQLKQFGKIRHSHTANAILQVCYRRGEVSQAVESFKGLEKRYGFKPNLHSFNILIRTHTRVGDVEGASTWFNNLLSSGFKPNQQTLVPLMAMFAKRGDLEAVKQLLRQSETYGIETNIAMIDSIVLAQVNNDQLVAAETLVHEALDTVENVPRSSRTRMWNYLLNAFAMRGDLDKVTELHRRMRVNNIPSNATTFAALMHGLSIQRQVAAAHRVLTEVMEQLAIVPSALHYAICMSGHLLVKNNRRVFTLYAEMLEKEVKPDIAVHNLLIRAAANIDSDGSKEKGKGADQQKYEFARQTFDQVLKDLDPVELATTEPIKFVGTNRVDESFTSSYFSYLIFLHGKQKAMDQVKDLYDRFNKTKSALQMDIESTPPIQMLSALMVAHFNVNDYEAVNQCWEMSLRKARKLACRAGARISEPGWVLPARRFILNVHLRHYIKSLVVQSKLDEVKKTIKHLHYCGYELDSKTWNLYVRSLVQNDEVLEAFEHCEKELIPGWEGWAPPNAKFMKKGLYYRQPKRLEPHRRLPAYDTLVYLAAAYVDAQTSLSVKGGTPLSQQLYKVAPKTVDVVHHLPRLDDPLQRQLLNRT